MNNRVIKFEIMLEAKEPGDHGYKVGERVKIVNEIFDRQNGVAFWEIDSAFEIIWRRQFTGLHAGEKELYEGDVLLLNDEHLLVYWSPGKASFQVKGDLEKGRQLTRAWLDTFGAELVGNIYEDEVLKDKFTL